MRILPIGQQKQKRADKNFNGVIKYVRNPLMNGKAYFDKTCKIQALEKLETQLKTVLNRTSSKLTENKLYPSESKDTFVKVFVANPKECYYSQKYNNDYCDFIFEDYEPAYPKIEDIEKNYFGMNRHNFVKDFEQIRDYFYRYEMGMRQEFKPIVCSFGPKANEYKATQEKQRLAQACIDEYHKAGHLRYEKEQLEDIENTEIFFAPPVDKNETTSGGYKPIAAKIVHLEWKCEDLKRKIDSNKSQHCNLYEVPALETELEKTLNEIREINNNRNKELLNESNIRRARISEIKRELAPMFENLKRLYEELKNIKVPE